jgi:hypothetical protein
MSTHGYTRVDEHGCLEFAQAVEAALPGKVFRVALDVSTEVIFEDELTAGEITTLDGVVGAFSPLDLRKHARVEEIDARTRGLISGGFTHSSVQISLSLNSQTRIHGAYTARALLVYPVEWNSIDDTALLTLVDAADIEAFFGAALGTIRTHIDSGTALKTSIRSATTQGELDAVVDGR